MKRAGFYLLLALIVLWSIAPFLWQLITSLKPVSQLILLPPLLPKALYLFHYVSVFTGQPFARFILNSLIVAGSTTIFSLIIGTFAAYAISRLRFPGRGLMLALVLSVAMFPPIATVSPLFLLIRWLGLRDHLLALIFPYITFTLPIGIWILTQFFRQIPRELERAAWIDGCTPFQSLYRIILPLALPGVASAAILIFIFAWNEFLYALTFTTTEASRTIPVGIALFPGIHELPWGEIAAASVIVTLPLVVLVLALQRRIVAGLTAGALKG